MSSRKPLILASASPRRRELLAHLCPTFEVIPSAVDEAALIACLGQIEPRELAAELAKAKATDVLKHNPDAVVVGADTIVVLDGLVLGKPIDEKDAARMLGLLSGRTHDVYTGVAVSAADRTVTEAVRTRVTFRTLTDPEIAAYIESGEPMDKAGSYGIQNVEISPVSTIQGDYYNVVGLPLAALRSLLHDYYADLPPAPVQPQ